MSLLLGIDLNISFTEVCVLDSESRRPVVTVRCPENSGNPSPGNWWRNLCVAISNANSLNKYNPEDIFAVGIVSHMNGIVLIDKDNTIRKKSFIQPDHLKCIKQKEPKRYSEIGNILLPADFIAMKLTREISTIPWPDSYTSPDCLIEKKFIPPIKNVFDIHGYLKNSMAERFGFGKGIPVSYKAVHLNDRHEMSPATRAAFGAGIGAHILKDDGLSYLFNHEGIRNKF